MGHGTRLPGRLSVSDPRLAETRLQSRNQIIQAHEKFENSLFPVLRNATLYQGGNWPVLCKTTAEEKAVKYPYSYC
jgi:hypothetical protein